MHFPRLILQNVYKQASTVTPKRGGTTNCYVSWPQNWASKFKLFAITAAVVQPTPLLIRCPEWLYSQIILMLPLAAFWQGIDCSSTPPVLPLAALGTFIDSSTRPCSFPSTQFSGAGHAGNKTDSRIHRLIDSPALVPK